MPCFDIKNKKYIISDDYNNSRSAWILPLEEETKQLILDFTILWNMVEHQVYNDSFDRFEKTTNCINMVIGLKDSDIKINNVYNIFKEYISKYNSNELFYEDFHFGNSRIKLEEIKQLLFSNDNSDKLKLLIYSCYRVRCNFFHGPKCIFDLNNQQLLFYSLNELLSLISKSYGM